MNGSKDRMETDVIEIIEDDDDPEPSNTKGPESQDQAAGSAETGEHQEENEQRTDEEFPVHPKKKPKSHHRKISTRTLHLIQHNYIRYMYIIIYMSK